MPPSRKARVTIASVDALGPDEILWDTDLKGFGVRRQARAVSYIVKTRVYGQQRWLTIGRHGSPWTPATARKEAVRLLREAASGHDPATEKEARKARITFAEAIVEYKAHHFAKLKPKTRYEYDRLIENVLLPKLARRKIEEITRADAAKLHQDHASTPRQANFALAVLSSILSWAEDCGYHAQLSNPCIGIRKYREAKRQRYLNTDELGRLGRALSEAEENGEISIAAAAAIRLLIFTGARLSEILTLQWSYLDFERNRAWLPDSKTGEKTINLNKPAVGILKSLPRLTTNPYVIVGARKGMHLVNLSKPWGLVRKKAGLNDVRLHDLRHSYASMGVAAGASLPMIGKLLGHGQAQTTARYAHLADDPIQDLNQKIGHRLSKAMQKTG
jgi:integrase